MDRIQCVGRDDVDQNQFKQINQLIGYATADILLRGGATPTLFVLPFELQISSGLVFEIRYQLLVKVSDNVPVSLIERVTFCIYLAR